MKTLIEGLFPKDRLLQYLRDFIVFEVANDVITKKGARYHQFFAVRLAALDLPTLVRQAATDYTTDVRLGRFPSEAESYK